MAGLEALAIFGVACNVMQTINFAHECISTFKQLREDGCIDPTLSKATDKLGVMTNALADSIKDTNQEDAELIKVARECSEIAQNLSRELERLASGPTAGAHGIKRTVVLGFKKRWNKTKIDKLEKDLNRVQRLMETGILIRLCKGNDAESLQREARFAELDKVLQLFIAGCARHETTMELLIKAGVFSAKEHTTNEHVTTRNQIKDHVTEAHRNTRMDLKHDLDSQVKELQRTFLTKEERAQLLESFDFPDRAQRISDIKEAHCKTFQWLFGDVPQIGSDNGHLYIKTESPNEDEVYERLSKECRSKTWHSFTSWLKSDGNLYWITAKAGSGKSTLMKFLSDDPRTRQLLDEKSGKTLIISHSFYLMGTPMQSNIKGLLCNILYQLIQADSHGAWTENLKGQHPEEFAQHRKSHTDWSTAKLQVVLRALLKNITASNKICLFLDGLDEVHPTDGKHALLNFLNSLRTAFPIKMCVSSRPEVEFKQALSSAPTLELHDLTAGDMYLYVLDLLSGLSEYSLEENPSRPTDLRLSVAALAETIVQKSDGVFLWTDIATRSLQRGVTNGDTWSMVQQRLEQMPEQLDQLFASMWGRLGKDNEVYRDEATLYFNLVLDWQRCMFGTLYYCRNPGHRTGGHDKSCGRNGEKGGFEMTLFHLAIAKRDSFTEDLGPWTSTLEIGSLWNDCLDLFTKLPIRSAGLLEFTEPLWRIDETGRRTANPDIGIRFIHRTAKDFFTDSIDGRKILDFDKSCFELRFSALLRAFLSRGLASGLPSEHFYLPLAKVNTLGLPKLFGDIQEKLEDKRRFRELAYCQAFHDYDTGVYHSAVAHPDFLGLLVGCSMKESLEFLSQYLSAYTTTYKSYLLVSAASAQFRPLNSSTWAARLEIINYLLSKGSKSELVIVPGHAPHKSTGLEEFLLSMSGFLKFPGTEQLYGSVIETLHHFARSGADFMAPVYGFYFRGLLKTAHPRIRNAVFLSPLSGIFEDFPQQVLVGWPILGVMTRVVKNWHRNDEQRKIPDFCQRLGEFVKTMNPDQRSLEPRVLAVRPTNKRDPFSAPADWLEHAKRVPQDKEKILMDSLSKSISWHDPARDDQIQKIQDETSQIVDSILNDDKIPAGITHYLLNELGFADSWPMFLAAELGYLKITCSDDGKYLPQGVVYPPAKYIE